MRFWSWITCWQLAMQLPLVVVVTSRSWHALARKCSHFHCDELRCSTDGRKCAGSCNVGSIWETEKRGIRNERAIPRDNQGFGKTMKADSKFISNWRLPCGSQRAFLAVEGVEFAASISLLCQGQPPPWKGMGRWKMELECQGHTWTFWISRFSQTIWVSGYGPFCLVKDSTSLLL